VAVINVPWYLDEQRPMTGLLGARRTPEPAAALQKA
jgi:hypothetical protein